MYSDCISSSELARIVLGLHTRYMSTDDAELLRKIQEYKCYRLMDVPVDMLSVNLSLWLNNERVVQYSEMDMLTQPPIVLGCVYTTGKYEVVDGVHRAAATLKRGLANVSAYVRSD